MRAHADEAGLPKGAIFNSCAVTAEAERQLRQSVRKERRENPDTLIIVTGCAAQIKPDSYAAMEEVDFVLGNDLKTKLETFKEMMKRLEDKDNTDKQIMSDIQKAKDTALHLVNGFEGRTRAFVQVQNGCDNRCTFCVIPYGRGASRSVQPREIIEQTKILVKEGYPEIALTGVDITSYGKDLDQPLTLGQLIRQILDAVPDLKWLRLSSLDPAAIDDDLWDIYASEERLLPYMHLSLQAGDDMVLKRMARRHRRQDVLDLCAKARELRPDIVFGADVIAGFPTETDEMAKNTLDLIKETGITWLHVFPYSAREGTPAAKMPQVEMKDRRARAAKLREAGKENIAAHLNTLIGQKIEVHVEKPHTGRTPTFAEAIWDENTPAEIGTLIWVEAIGQENNKLLAKRIKK